ncbi:MAG: T9SS type A sorting domain-containing protein [Hymenobacteraceae bacterium]|nr:T9SS type A sorting domain-containing protein [Hymenobacteraceae bacterium]
MRTLRHIFGTALTIAALTGLTPLVAQAQTPYNFPSGAAYSEDFSTLGTWTGIAQGATTVTYAASPVIAAPTRFQRPASNTTNNTMTTASPLPSSLTTINAFSTSSSSSTGTQNTGIAKMVMLASGTGNAAGLDLFLDFTGRNAGNLTFNWASVANGAYSATPTPTNNRFGTLQVYASVNGTTWVQVGSDIVAQNNALDPGVNNPAGAGGASSAGLPSIFNNSNSARLRFYVHSVATLANNPATPATGGTRPKISIDNIGVTSTVGGVPTFTPATGPIATPTTTTAGPSTGVSVSFGGSNLTANVTATVTGAFELATTINGTYGASATIPQNLSGTLFVRLNPAAAGTTTGTISYTGGGVTPSITGTTSVTGLALAVEPTTQPTLTAVATGENTATLTLAGGNGAKYLVIARSGSPYQNLSGFQSSNLPVDGQAYAPSTVFGSGGTVGTAGVFTLSSSASTTINVTGLLAGTSYSFVAFAYNDDNATGAQNYLATGIPVNSSPGTLAVNVTTATTDQAPGTQYTWSGPANGSWNTAGNWTPTRTTPAGNDFLDIPGGSSITYDVGADQTVGNLSITGTGTVTITLSGATSRLLTVAFAPAGTDFSIPLGTTLRLRPSATTGTALNMTIGSGSTGSIAGTLDLNGTSALITSPVLFTGTGTVKVVSGGLVTVGSFATGASLAGAGLIFQNGSTLTKNGGSSPTATFQPTSTFNWNVNGTLSFSGKTYGNLNLLDYQNNASQIGGGLLTINNLTYSATGKTLSLDLTGGINIDGNINVTAGTLKFQPASAGSLTLTSSTATVTSVSPITFSNLTLNKPTGSALQIDDVIVGSGNLTLSSALNILNSLTFSGAGNVAGAGVLTLVSTPTQTAYVVSTGAGTGTATVQRAISASSEFMGVGYRHYASPVTGSTVADLEAGSFMPIVDPAYNSAMPPVYTSATFPNVFTYDPTKVLINSAASFTKGYQSPAGLGDALVVGKGYSVRKGNQTVDFIGTLTTGNKPLTLAGNGTGGGLKGWNLLGNPYASPLDWKKVRDAGAIPATVQATIYFYRPTANGTFYDATSGLSGDDFNSIALAQGFFARKNTATGTSSINLTNAMRTTGTGNGFNRAVPTDRPYVKLAIANVVEPTVRPKTLVYFDEDATNGFDGYHDGFSAGRSTGNVPYLATLIEGEEAAVNALSTIPGAGEADVVVPMLVATSVAGTYTISTYKVLNVPAGTQVILEDALTGTAQDMMLNGEYTFRSTADYVGQRFTLRFTAGRVTGLSADLSASSLSVYPNPASGTVRIGAPAGATVLVIDALGRTVRTVRIDGAGSEATLGLSGLQAGLYTVRAGAASRKLVIQ